MKPIRLLIAVACSALVVSACTGSANLVVEIDEPSPTSTEKPTAAAEPTPTTEPTAAAEPTAVAEPTATPEQQPAPTTEPADSDGVWLVEGYGYVLETVDGQVDATYLPIGDLCMPAEFPELVSFEIRDGTARIEIPDSINWYAISPMTFPQSCETFAFDAAPSEIIDSFITLMDERYPFFAERGVDWPSAQAELRTAVADATEAEAAANAISAFFWNVGDSHNQIDSELPPPESFVEEWTALETALETAWAEVTTALGDSQRTDATEVVTWGRLTPSTGYINIDRLAGFDGRVDDPSLDQELLAAALDSALGELQDTTSIVLDVRFNGGGSDSVSLEAISRFIDEPLDVFTKESYSEPEATRQLISVDPTERVDYDGQVAVLVSPATASAAEILAAGMREAGATIVGPRSEGIFSDVIPWLLPGGIEMGISMEVYRDLDGVSYEVRGVPIDVNATIAESLDSALALG